MSGVLLASTGAMGFGQRTVEYTTGSGTETVPLGATSCVITANARGGDGQAGSGGTPGTGGGGGGYSQKTVPVTGGQTFSYTVNSSLITVTSAAPVVSLTANSGGHGSAGGAGGTASGGDTNTTGQAGASITGGSSPNGGGPQGTQGAAGNFPGGGGAGGTPPSNPGGSGALPRLRFFYT